MKGRLLTSEFQGSFNRYYRYLAPIVRDPLIQGYFEIVATIILISVLVLFAIRPSLKTIADLNRQIQDLTVLRDKANRKLRDLYAARQNFQPVENRLSVLTRALPERPEVATIIVDTEALVKGRKLDLTGLTVEKTGLTSDVWKKNNGYAKGEKLPVGFSLVVRNSYPQAQNLLAGLLSLPRLVHFNRVNFAGDGKGDVLTVTYQGEAYFLPEGDGD